MIVYLDLVMGLNFGVDLLLLMGANRLCGYPAGAKRCAPAAALGAVYGAICLLPGMAFLGNLLWRTLSLAAMAIIAFGWQASALRRGVLFLLLSMALGGIALGIGQQGFWGILLAAAGVCGLCVLGFRRGGAREYVPMELSWGGKKQSLTALRDTGNTLLDPITGESVLVAGAEIAGQLLGLTAEELLSPMQTVCDRRLPGLRLIPYKAVGQERGLLLAVRMQERTSRGTRSRLVAFAPQSIGSGGAYQALTGGTL